MENEDRLISANKLMDAINFEYDLNYGEILTDPRRFADMVEDAPTVDAVEVVHGRWELHGNDDDCGCSYFCSNCHESYDEDWFYVHGQNRHWNYCPNCGAKMDGDQK